MREMLMNILNKQRNRNKNMSDLKECHAKKKKEYHAKDNTYHIHSAFWLLKLRFTAGCGGAHL